MNRQSLYGAFAALLLAWLVACSGTAARNTVLLPAMQNAWSAIRVCVLREVAANPTLVAVEGEVYEADAAIASGNPLLFNTVDWPLIHSTADADTERRLQAGLIGPGTAGSLREELRLFIISRNTFTRGQQ